MKANIKLELELSEMLDWYDEEQIKQHIEKFLYYKTENVEIKAKVTEIKIQKLEGK